MKNPRLLLKSTLQNLKKIKELSRKKINMKKTIIIFVLTLCFSIEGISQKTETYDIITFNTLKDWNKEVKTNSIAFGKDNGKDGLGLIMIFKSKPSEMNAIVNFRAFWELVVKDIVNIAGEVKFEPTRTEYGWTTEAGIAQYNGSKHGVDLGKGMAILITKVGGGKVVNFVIFNNSPANNEEIFNFIDSITLPSIKVKKSIRNQTKRKKQ